VAIPHSGCGVSEELWVGVSAAAVVVVVRHRQVVGGAEPLALSPQLVSGAGIAGREGRTTDLTGDPLKASRVLAQEAKR